MSTWNNFRTSIKGLELFWVHICERERERVRERERQRETETDNRHRQTDREEGFGWVDDESYGTHNDGEEIRKQKNGCRQS